MRIELLAPYPSKERVAAPGVSAFLSRLRYRIDTADKGAAPTFARDSVLKEQQL